MARASFNVLVYPYRSVAEDQFEYALLERTDARIWRLIAGEKQMCYTCAEVRQNYMMNYRQLTLPNVSVSN